MKTYSSKSNARRAALKQFGEGNFDLTGSGKEWSFKELVHDAPAPKPAKKTKAPKPAKAPKVEAATEDSEIGAIPRLHKSSVQHPVQYVWDLFDKLRERATKKGETLRRKDAIAIAEGKGVAFYTARTQYQSWKTANKF